MSGEQFLRDIERIACAALSMELSSADVTRLVGELPVDRGPDWAKTRVGWVRSDAIQRLLKRASRPERGVLVRHRPLA